MKSWAVILVCFVFAFTISSLHSQDLRWAHNFGSDWGSFEGIVCSGVAHDSKGNTVVAGNFQGSTDFDPSNGSTILTASLLSNAFIAKYNSSGALMWAKNITSSISTDCYAMTVDKNDNIVVVGSFQGVADFDPGDGTHKQSEVGEGDMFVASYDADGNYFWANAFGSKGLDRVIDVCCDNDGSIVIGGYFRGQIDFDPGAGEAMLTSKGGLIKSNLFIAKYSSNGVYNWASSIIGQNESIDLALNDTVVYASGTFRDSMEFNPSTAGAIHLSGNSSGNLYWAKFNSVGNCSLAHAATGATGISMSGNPWRGGKGLAIDFEGNLYLCGSCSGAVDFEPGSGKYVFNTTSSSAAYLAGLNSEGILQWLRIFDYDACTPTAIAVQGQEITMCGSFVNRCDFDPSASEHFLEANGYRMFLAKYRNNQGSFISAHEFGGSNQDYCTGLALRGFGVTVAGDMISDTCDFDLRKSADIRVKEQSVFNNIFIAQYDFLASDVSDSDDSSSALRLYPTPTYHDLHIQCASASPLISIRFYNQLGILVREETVASNVEHYLQCDLPNGLYIVQVKSGTRAFSRSIVVAHE